MTETTDRLVFVSMDGHRLPHSRAELIHAPWGWQVELYDVPPVDRPRARQIGGITLEAVDGGCCEGTAIAELVSEDGGFVVLGGIGRLRLIAPADAAEGSAAHGRGPRRASGAWPVFPSVG